MSQYLDKEKLLKWLDMQNRGEIEEYELDRAAAYGNVYKEIKDARFDNYAAHNAVAQFDDLEIKLNEANREIESLKTELSETQMMCHNFQRMANGYFAELQQLRYPDSYKERSDETSK